MMDKLILKEKNDIDPLMLKEREARVTAKEMEIDRLIELKVAVRTATLRDRVLKLTYELQQARRVHSS